MNWLYVAKTKQYLRVRPFELMLLTLEGPFAPIGASPYFSALSPDRKPFELNALQAGARIYTLAPIFIEVLGQFLRQETVFFACILGETVCYHQMAKYRMFEQSPNAMGYFEHIFANQ